MPVCETIFHTGSEQGKEEKIPVISAPKGSSQKGIDVIMVIKDRMAFTYDMFQIPLISWLNSEYIIVIIRLNPFNSDIAART